MHTIKTARAQRGAILVTSLLLLLILTVLGVAMMRVTNMQERMAANTRDLNLALQGAEMALRQAEGRIQGWFDRPISTSASGCELCQSSALPVAMYDAQQFDWSTAQQFQATGQATSQRLAAPPRYTMEELAFVPYDLGGGLEPTTAGRDVYQITGRSTGASGLANTVLQGTFTKRY